MPNTIPMATEKAKARRHQRVGIQDQIIHGLSQNERQQVAQGDADEAAQSTQDGGLHQELPHDLPPGRADGLLDADFPGPLRDGDQHDVHDTDSAHQQGDARDAAQYHAHGGHLLRALAHGGVAVLQLILPHARVDGLPRKRSSFAITVSMWSD